MIGARAILMVAALSAIALSGCTDNGSETPAGTDNGTDGQTMEPAAENFEVQAPEWSVGRYFGHHVFFGAADTTGTHINTIVYDETSSDYLLATDNRDIAELHAIFDIPILGALSKTDLSTTSFGGPQSAYKFPMRDGTTWSGKVTMEQDQFGGPVSRDVDFVATFNPAVRMVVSGKEYPGFDIVGTSEGKTLIETNYIPEVGWYGEFVYYDFTTEDVDDDFIFRVISMGFGHDFASDLGGTVLVIEATELVNHFQQTILPNAEVSPFYQETFTVSAEATKMMGIIFAFAVVGHSEIDFVDPAQALHRWQVATDVPLSPDQGTWGTGGGNLYTLPVLAGDWEMVSWNLGFAAGGGAQIWELTEEQIIF